MDPQPLSPAPPITLISASAAVGYGPGDGYDLPAVGLVGGDAVELVLLLEPSELVFDGTVVEAETDALAGDGNLVIGP